MKVFLHVYFSNEIVSQPTVSTGPNENVSFGARNYERFVQMECRFDKIKDIFQGFGRKVEVLKVNKLG